MSAWVMRRSRPSMLIGVILLSAASCGGGSAASGANASDVSVTLRDFSITPDPSSADAGTITFDITNDGPSTHEFAVVRTDLAPGALPVEGGEIPEDKVDIIDEAEDIAPSTSTSLEVQLSAGTYVLICNLPGHYQSGMHAAFTVR